MTRLTISYDINLFVLQLDLVPDQHSEGAKVTTCKHKTLNPTYNEIFTFSLQPEAIPDTLLRVQIWSQDPVGNDDFMGERIIELGRLDFNEVITGWYDMQAEVRGYKMYIYALQFVFCRLEGEEIKSCCKYPSQWIKC